LIPGLYFVRNFLDVEAQRDLVQKIDDQPWRTGLRRRVQHYGAAYDYGKHSVALGPGELALAPLPDWGKRLVDRINGAGIVNVSFGQMIVNEYLPGQGIGPHIDSGDFGPEIITVSLCSACTMTFSRPGYEECLDLWVQPGDLMLLTQEARYLWRHQIRPRKQDLYQGQKVQRQRRVSVTLRTVVVNGKVKLESES
jgi:alkylated DNA repair dioxygenase AlkB